MLRIIDNLSELVYVVDLATYNLLYVNKTCIDKFRLKEWKGEKCYRLLQGREDPCPFCNIDQLKEGKELCWQFFNPVVKCHYQLRDTLIEWEGNFAKLEIANDINDLVERQQEQEKLLQAELLINRCARNLTHLDNTEDALNHVLQELGEFFGCDRVYIFQIKDRVMNNTHEWCGQGVVSEREFCQNMPVELIDRWIPDFKKDKCFEISSLEDIRDFSPNEYAALSDQGIRSLIASPIKKERQLIGYIGIDNYPPDQEKTVLQLLPSVSYFISVMLRYTIMMDQDLLTGIYNRNRYIRDMENGVAMPVGVIYMDINGMKQINDEQSHGNGDLVLKKAAKLLKKIFPDGVCYRIGGDEFAVILPEIQETEFGSRVSKLRYELATEMDFDASVGSEWSSREERLETLMAQADEKMYTQKKEYYRSRRLTRRYRHYLDFTLDLIRTGSLKRKISEGCFQVYYQPKFSVAEGLLTGAEALVRYRGENGELHSPMQFVTEMEENGVIDLLDYYVFEQVCRQISDWKAEGIRPVPVAVNFSRYTLAGKEFTEQIERIRRAYQVPPALLEIEVTETMEAENMCRLYGAIDELQKSGFRVAIDDFGARYANLNLLSDAHFNVLKIDMHIISNLKQDTKEGGMEEKARGTNLLVRHLTDICSEFGLYTVAEGVESKEQLEALKNTKCDEVQGYFFSCPITSKEYTERFLKERPD